MIVQSNPFNESRIATVVIAVITSKLALAAAPGNVRVARSDSGLGRPSVVNISQVLTIDRALLADRVRILPAQVMRASDEGLRLVKGL